MTGRRKSIMRRQRTGIWRSSLSCLVRGSVVSECVGLNINDVDFRNGGLRIHRKGGKEVIVYFGAEVEYALQDYLSEREHIVPEEGSEEALFLSMQRKRINVRSVGKWSKNTHSSSHR